MLGQPLIYGYQSCREVFNNDAKIYELTLGQCSKKSIDRAFANYVVHQLSEEEVPLVEYNNALLGGKRDRYLFLAPVPAKLW